ncbi:hypothetical protein R5R35_009502 [Gryllus longicercus]|uniref:Kinesin-like protein n=1 Tax=Gryllus longicercus TaxID=2509291 RepID=A0AAN9VC22_9ORTH|nr:Kinesin-like protein Klp68D [Gryllus bimaculatus]
MDKNKFAARRGPSNEAVQVVVRCRPMNAKELANGFKKVVDVHPSRGVIEILNPRDDGKERKKSFTFDAVYDAMSTQEELYNETAHPLVSSILDGFNGTIFAYGQTGTGKTYTMEGSKPDPSQKGIILRSFDQIFNYISRSKNMQYLVRTSYLEIYQEEIRDLLSKDRRKTYELREAAGIGVYVKDLSSFVCKSAKEIEHVMYVGNQNRSIGATNMNDHSSRSHAIFMITIEMSDTDSFKKIIRVGKLNLIDLAGSERQSKTGATGERLKEASKINLSLSALGNVISALVDGKNPHIPYRDSKLTRILQDSLGGNSKTIMVANIGPASYNYDETLTTLRYANRAKNIKNKPRVNEDPKDALLREYQMEIARLKGLLAERARQRELLLAVPVTKHEGNEDKDDSESGDKDSTDTEEKLRLMKELEEKKELLAREKYASEKLEMKIRAMESKLLCGGKNIIDHTNEQQRALEQQKQEIAERKKREVEMRQKLELQEESALEIRDTYTTLQQEVDYKTKKLKKLFARLQSIKQEIHDVTEEFNADRRDLEAAQNELLKDLKVRYLVIDNFIPADEKNKLLLRVRFDESDGSWYLLPLVPDNIVTVKRPVSSGGERRPVSDYGRVAIRLGRSHRYQGENILNLDLEPHPRTTSDYTGPIIAPKIHALLEEAMREEDDLDVDAAPLSNINFGARAKQSRKDREKEKLLKGNKARKKSSDLSSQSGNFLSTPPSTPPLFPKPRGLIPK